MFRVGPVMIAWHGWRSGYGWGMLKWTYGGRSSWRHGTLYVHVAKVMW